MRRLLLNSPGKVLTRLFHRNALSKRGRSFTAATLELSSEQKTVKVPLSPLTGSLLHNTYFYFALFGVGISELFRGGAAFKQHHLDKIDSYAVDNLRKLKELVEKKQEEQTFRTEIMNRFSRYYNNVFAKLKSSPLELRAGLGELGDLHREHLWFRQGVVRKKTIAKDDLVVMERLMRFNASTYGWKTLHFLGLGNSGMDTNIKGVCLLTGVKEDQILHMEDNSKLFRPGHYVVVDHETKRVVVAIRGTFQLQDLLTDCICDDVPLNIHQGGETISGVVHEGFYKAAQNLAVELHNLVTESLEKYSDYDLSVTGHSYGSACSSLLALIWQNDELFKQRNVHAYSFAPACCMSVELASSEFVRKHVTSVVLGDDFISRLCLVSVEKLAKVCDFLVTNKNATLQEKKKYLETVKAEDRKNRMVPGGTVYHIPLKSRFGGNDGNFDVHLAEEVDPSLSLGEIVISPKMLDVHLPVHYLNAIRQQFFLQY